MFHLCNPWLSLTVTLAAYRVANVLDCFPNFSSRFADAFFYFAPCLIGATLSGEFIVIECPADTFLHIALSLIPFSFNFISVW